MKRLLILGATLFALSAAPALAAAGDWVLNEEDSKVAYGSIKKDTVGESNHFTSLSGSVSNEGAVRVEIDLTSVETWIDIRNERMVAYVFDGIEPAVFSATVDMGELTGLAPGEVTTTELKGTLSFGSKELPVETDIFVARLTDKRVLVTTDEMIMLSTDDLDLNPGIDKLMELAKLPGITRVAPVTLRLLFDQQ
ncbi:hypothetical protein ACTL6U_02765 [Rhodovibrionaceae bacterium A322]